MSKVPVSLVDSPSDPVVKNIFSGLESKGPVGVANLHRVLAHSPQVFAANFDLSIALRNDTELEPALRELAILRALFLHQGHYEIAHHRNIGRSVGLDDSEINAACSDAPSTDFSDPKKSLVVAFAEQFARGKGIADTTIRQLSDQFSERLIVELSLTTSIYIGLSYLTAALDVPKD